MYKHVLKWSLPTSSVRSWLHLLEGPDFFDARLLRWCVPYPTNTWDERRMLRWCPRERHRQSDVVIRPTSCDVRPLHRSTALTDRLAQSSSIYFLIHFLRLPQLHHFLRLPQLYHSLRLPQLHHFLRQPQLHSALPSQTELHHKLSCQHHVILSLPIIHFDSTILTLSSEIWGTFRSKQVAGHLSAEGLS